MDVTNLVFIKHIESKKHFRKTFRQAEAMFKASIEKCIEECSELDQRQFWYLLKKDQKSRKHGHILKDNNGEIVTDQKVVSEMWKSHFDQLGKPSMCDNYDDDFKDFVESEVKSFELSQNEMVDNVLSDPVSPDEVERVCRKLKTGKAQDFRGLSYEHLSMLAEVFLLY